MTTVDSRVNTAVQEMIDRFVTESQQIGMQVCAYKDGEVAVDAVAGQMGPEDTRPVQRDSLFLSFSATKGVASTVVHMLVDRGQLDYDAPVAQYWPEFGQHGKDRVTVAQALSHQAGLHAMRRPFVPDHACDWEAGLKYMAEGVPAYEPGTATGYHAFTWGWLVGGIVRGATGRHIRDVIEEDIAQPLGIAGEMYVGIPDGIEERLTTLEIVGAGTGMDIPEDSDFYKAMPPEMWQYFNDMDVRKACVPSGNGHFSARALAKMYAALANGGEVGGVRLVSPERIGHMQRLMTDDVDLVIGMPIRKTTGYFTGGETGGIHGPMGPRESAFGHPGAGGPIGYADPDVNLAIAVTHNKMAYPGPGEGTTLEVCDLIRRELGAE